MEANTGMDTDVIEQLIHLQGLDRARDRLQRRLDEVPIRLRRHTDAIAALEAKLREDETQLRLARAEADRAELEVRSREEQREKIKRQMNAPKLTNREYQALQEHLAGVLADINSFSDQALKAMERASEAEARVAGLTTELEKARSEYNEARDTLEGSLADVRAELGARTRAREEFAAGIPGESLDIYERVRRKHKEALATVGGTIDRAAGRIGSDLHCSTCYISVTANDAVKVLARRSVVQCKSCARILYVP